MNLTNLQSTSIHPLLEGYYHSLHSEYINMLNIEFKNYILEESDIGSIILYRIDGMPLLEEVFEMPLREEVFEMPLREEVFEMPLQD